MPSLENWDPHKTHVQGGLPAGNFVNGQFVLLCAGPPFFNQLSGLANPGAQQAGTTMVYPIGLAQNISLSQSKSVNRVFEIGSDRSYFITGRSVGQLSLSRIIYNGPGLLRALWAYYNTQSDTSLGGVQIRPLIANTMGSKPFKTGVPFGTETDLHSVKIPPGYDNMFTNLASDLFSQPTGLLLIIKDNNDNNYSTMYLEQCYVPSYSIAVESQGLIMQESVGIQYERLVPVKLAQLNLFDGIRPDVEGAYTGDQPA